MWTARVRTPTLGLSDWVGFHRLELVERYGTLGPDSLAIDGLLDELGSAKLPGHGLVVWDETGAQRFSGWVTPIQRHGDGTGTIVCVSDTTLLWDRLAWAAPLAPWTQPNQIVHTVTGPMETRILNLIQRNAGNLAYNEGPYAGRRIAALRLPASEGRGGSATTGVWLQDLTLGDLTARLAELADLRVTIRQTYEGTTPYLDVLVDDTPDLTAWAQFGDAKSGQLGLLGDWEYSIGAPGATILLPIAGSPDVADDTYIAGVRHVPSRETVWGRYIEKFVDLRGTTDASELAERLDEVVAETVPTVEVQAPIVSGDLEFGTGTGQIPLGAKVAVTLDGETVVERIRQVTTTVQATEGSPTVTVEPLVGSPDSGLTVEQKTLRAALRRLRRLESQ
jgi:hypothetical protein